MKIANINVTTKINKSTIVAIYHPLSFIVVGYSTGSSMIFFYIELNIKSESAFENYTLDMSFSFRLLIIL